MDILNRILELRSRRGWSEWKLAEESNLKQSTISSWYAKNQLPKIPSLEKICHAFGITMAQFFCEENESVNLTPDQWEMLENWSALSNDQKDSILLLMKNMPPKDAKQTDNAPSLYAYKN